ITQGSIVLLLRYVALVKLRIRCIEFVSFRIDVVQNIIQVAMNDTALNACRILDEELVLPTSVLTSCKVVIPVNRVDVCTPRSSIVHAVTVTDERAVLNRDATFFKDG